ncbi:MAG: O-antigen ligase family protein [Actinomycetota bacterium]
MIDVLVVAAAIGTAFQKPTFPGNLSIVDPVFVLVNLVAFRYVLIRANPGSELLRRLLPWLWLLCVSTIVTMIRVGIPFWLVSTFAREILAVITFAGLVAVLAGRPRTIDRARIAFLAAVAFVALTNIFEIGGRAGERQAGLTVRNVNYAAHLLAMGLLVLGTARNLRRSLRWPLAGVYLLALVRTGSFGALLSLLAATVYVVWRATSHFRGQGRVLVRIVSLAALLAVGAWGVSSIRLAEFDVGSGVDSNRLTRSESSRIDTWRYGLEQLRSHPYGIGPGGYEFLPEKAGTSDEMHSDPLAFLVEHGPLGLVAFLGIAYVLWRAAPPASASRVVLVAFAAGGLVRQTFTFRYIWIALAIVLASDLLDRRQPAQDPVMKAG